MSIKTKAKYLALSHFEGLMGGYFRVVKPTLQDMRDLIFTKSSSCLSVPDRLVFEVSNVCNARCVFCAYRKLNLKPQFMTQETFKEAIAQAKSLGIKKLMFSPTIGENFTDPNFFRKIAYAKSQGMWIEICTNGIMLTDKELCKKIIITGVDRIGISMGDIDIALEAQIMGIDQITAMKKIRGIKTLLQYKEFFNSHIDIALSIRPARPFKKIYKAFRSDPTWNYFLKKDYFTLSHLLCFDNWAGTITQNDLVGTMKLGRIRTNRSKLCSHFKDLIILPNGNVRLCGCRIKTTEDDELVIGNILDNDLKIIIERTDLSQFLLPPKGTVPEVCKECISYCT